MVNTLQILPYFNILVTEKQCRFLTAFLLFSRASGQSYKINASLSPNQDFKF